jgi:hypothetical protein
VNRFETPWNSLRFNETELHRVSPSCTKSQTVSPSCRSLQCIAARFSCSQWSAGSPSACTGQDVGLYDIEDVLNPRVPRSTPSAYSRRDDEIMIATETAGWRVMAACHDCVTSVCARRRKYARIVWARERLAPALRAAELRSWEDVHYACGRLGVVLRAHGNGLVFEDAERPHTILGPAIMRRIAIRRCRPQCRYIERHVGPVFGPLPNWRVQRDPLRYLEQGSGVVHDGRRIARRSGRAGHPVADSAPTEVAKATAGAAAHAVA